MMFSVITVTYENLIGLKKLPRPYRNRMHKL